MDKATLKRELKKIGTQSEIAELLGLKQQSAISSWTTERRPVPAEHCVMLEYLSKRVGGNITRYNLRPDVFYEVEEKVVKVVKKTPKR